MTLCLERKRKGKKEKKNGEYGHSFSGAPLYLGKPPPKFPVPKREPWNSSAFGGLSPWNSPIWESVTVIPRQGDFIISVCGQKPFYNPEEASIPPRMVEFSVPFPRPPGTLLSRIQPLSTLRPTARIKEAWDLKL
jgi:hypothetical protein